MSEQKKMDDRAAFEAYMLGREHPVIGWIDGHWFSPGDDPATYANDYVQGCWVMWQARSLPVGVPDTWPRLVRPAKVGAGVFSAGLSARLVVEAAYRQYEYAAEPPFTDGQIKSMAALAAAPAAPTVKAERAISCTKPDCFPYCDCGGVDDPAPVVKAEQVPADRAVLVAEMRKAAGEIASAGHFGWGNAMTAAADALEAPCPPASGSTDVACVKCGRFLEPAAQE